MAHELRNKKLPTGIILISKEWAGVFASPLISECSFFTTTEPCETLRGWDHWASEMLEFNQKPEHYCQSSFNTGSKVPSFLGMLMTHLLLTTAAWGKLLWLLPLFQILNTSHKQTPLAPVVKTSVFHLMNAQSEESRECLVKCMPLIWK